MKKVQETRDLNEETQAGAADKRILRARQRAIGRELRRFYDGVVEEAVPEDFLELLSQINGAGKDGEDGESS